MKKYQKYIVISVSSCALFFAGAFTGKLYSDYDLLCSSPSPHTLSSDMVSKGGIVFPKGTIVPLESCAYRQRFHWEFAIDNSIEFEASKVAEDKEFGFSQLEVIE